MSDFDKEAMTYDDWYKTKLGSFVDEVETACIFNMLDLPRGSKILDVGCGSGNYSIKLAELGYEVVGVDLSKEMLMKAKEKADDRNLAIDFREMDVYELDFDDESFDAAFSITAFEFIPDIQKAMDEVMRVLKKSGQMIIGMVNRDSSWGKLYMSPEYQAHSVFKYANLKTVEEMKTYYPENFIESDQCLFVGPEAKDDKISLEEENRLKGEGVEGGFICLKWIKL
jgi:ubiquinone/menaquinone biosynthesis C-methylase UbiE